MTVLWKIFQPMTAQLWNLNCRVVSWFVERLKVLDGCKFWLLYHRKTVQRKETRRPRLIEVSCGTYYLTWLVVCYRKAKLGRRCGPSYQKLGLQRRRQYQVCHHDQRCTMVNLTKKNPLELLKSLFCDIEQFASSVTCRKKQTSSAGPKLYIPSTLNIDFILWHT